MLPEELPRFHRMTRGFAASRPMSLGGPHPDLPLSDGVMPVVPFAMWSCEGDIWEVSLIGCLVSLVGLVWVTEQLDRMLPGMGHTGYLVPGIKYEYIPVTRIEPYKGIIEVH